MINATELFEKLVESGIRFGYQVVRGPGDTFHTFVHMQKPFIAERRPDDRFAERDGDLSVAEVVQFLGTTAAELYPDSEFAKWWRERA